MRRDAVVRSLVAGGVDGTLASQLIEEAIGLEEAFVQRKWKYSELDGGRFAEIAARVVYAADSGNVALTKGVDDCLKYVDNQQVPHRFPEPQTAVHLSKVIRSVYKLRSQRGAVHVSPTFTANELDSRLVLECARWLLADLLRVFAQIGRDEIVAVIRDLARFPQPLIRTYSGIPLLQHVAFTAEEEVLAHLFFSDSGRTTSELVSAIPKHPSGVRRAVAALQSAGSRQVVSRDGKLTITDLGIARIEARISREGALSR